MLAILLNRSSGAAARRQDIRERIDARFQHHGLDVTIHELTDPSQTAIVARAALASAPDTIVAGGGDGTVSAVASTLAGQPTPLGVLPLGTLNHFAKDLHIPLDLDEAIDNIFQRHITRVDVGRIGDRTFINNCSIGIYPSIVETRERLRKLGYPKWASFMWATIGVLRRNEEVTIRLESAGTQVAAHTPFLFVGNNAYQVEGIHLGARMRIDDGLLYAYFAPPVRTRHLPKLLAQALLGHARQDHALASLSAVELRVDTPSVRGVNVACDGEVSMMIPPLRFRAWPLALNVVTPAP